MKAIDHRLEPIHSGYICLRDLFPGKTLHEADGKMAELADLFNDWADRNEVPLVCVWLNQLERDENPDGSLGRFRLDKTIEVPDPATESTQLSKEASL